VQAVRCIVTRNSCRIAFFLLLSMIVPASLFAAAPTITSLSPTSGAVGASVTITGTNFGATQGSSTVTFNTTNATSITSWSATSIVVTVPAGATTGSVSVTVGGVVSNKKTFTVVAAPSITSLSPTSGAVGAAVTITGTNFTTTKGTVTFNGVAASITSWAATSIKVTVPSGATTGNVVVFASGVYSNGVAFTVVPAPAITSLSPTQAAVGASVTISGTAFGSTQGTGTVTFNGTKATITSWSATSIVATVPSATTGNVVVNASGVASNGVSFTVLPTPTITTLSPSTGAVGASVTIAGSGFNATQGTSTVTFNGTLATVSSWSATSIVTTVPTGATTGNVVVNTSGVASKGVKFTVVAAPSITKLSVTSGAVGTAVTITGTSFGSTQGTGFVSFNGTTATVTSWAATSVKVTVPTGATTGNVVVYASGVNSNGVLFTVFPSISSLSPSSAAIGAMVTITGLNFGSSQGSSTVKFNGTTATSISTWSTTSIVAVVPASTTSGNVVVTVGGNASTGVAFTVLPAPSITSLSTTSGAVTATVSITGTNFGATQGSGSVTFNGVAAPVTNWTATSISVTVPTTATTGNVVVNASGVASNGVAFTVLPTPTITSLSAASDAVGAAIVITGTGFGASQGSGTVKFNGVNASVTIWSATSITVTVPTGATTGNVVVYASGVNSNGSPFTVLAAPSISSISPTSGGAGASVTISGSNFGATQGSGSVTFNGVAAAITSWSASSIVATVPANATTGNVVVNASGVSSNGVSFTVLQGPSISSLSPTSAVVGASVTINGSNFGATQGSGSVSFNGFAATVTSWSATSIVATVPNGATTGNVVVTANGLNSNGVSFTVLTTPNITSVSPNSATVGTSVTITGLNFGATQGSSTVTFNGVTASVSSWSATSIVTAVPTGATTGNVVVKVSGVASNGVLMTVVSSTLPAVVQVQPANLATGVPENGRVVVRLAQAVQPSVIVAGTLTLSQGSTSITGTVTLSNDGLSITFAPSQNLAASTNYSVAVTNVAGGQNTPEFQSTFTTGSTTDTTNPQIVLTSPQSGNTNFPTSAPIVAQFTKPMDPATLTPQNFTVYDDTAGVYLSATVEVNATGTIATFVPQQPLGVGREFQAYLSSSIEDTSGNSLTGSATEFGFTTAFSPDTTQPQLLGISPSNGATNVPTNGLIVLGFSKPIDPISLTNGFQVQSGGQPVAGGVAMSNGNELLTFTPTGGLTASTTYNVTVSSQVTDIGGLALSNPATYSFVTGTTTNTNTPKVSVASPVSYATGVPTNSQIQLEFNEPIDPLTVTSTTFELIPSGTSTYAPGTIAVSSNGLIATFTPTIPFYPSSTYLVIASNGITDVAGNPLQYYETYLFTGPNSDTTSPTVTLVSPANGETGTPVNIRVDVNVSTVLSGTSVGSGTVTLSAGGVSVPGTVGLSSTGTTLSFVSTSLLSPSTTYTVSVSGATDEAGNVITPFTSTFTTGTSTTANTTPPAVASMSPAAYSTGVSVNSPIVLTFNEPIDFTTVSTTTVPISVSGFSGDLAGTYSLDSTGKVLTFTPATPLPGNAMVYVQITYNGIADLSGNLSSSYEVYFTTGSGTTTTGPTVVSVTPQNGATGIGTNATIVLTFSESLNSSTVTTSNIGVLVNGTPLVPSISISADNRTVTVNPYGVAGSATVSVLVSNGVTDLYGNPATPFESIFTTGPALSQTAPYVVSQRPAAGATGVPLNDSIVLYFSLPMNTESVIGALHVAMNGVLVPGTTQVSENGQVVQFTPSSPFPNNQVVQVFVDGTAQSSNGVNMNAYPSSFTTVANLSTTPASQIASNPAYGIQNVPTNVVMDMQFNMPLNPASLTDTSVLCYQNGTWFQNAVSLIDGGTVIQVAPRSPLPPNTPVQCYGSTNLVGTNGVASYGGSLQLITGSGPDYVVPTIVTTSPQNGLTNVGDNANVRLLFSKPINPITVNSSTIQLSGGGITFVPDSISFSNSNQMVLLTPHSPLPDNTLMTLTVSGITDVAGNSIVPQTTTFTTGTGPDVVPPVIVWASPLQANPYYPPTNVPLNAIMQVQTNESIDPGTVNSNTFPLFDETSGVVQINATYSVSTDGRTITLIPSAPLTANHHYYVYAFNGMADLAGNTLSTAVTGVMGNFNFTTGTTSSTNGPQVTGISPSNGATVPINAQVAVAFNEAIDPATLSGLTLTGPGGAVTAAATITNGNQLAGLVPVVPLAPSTQYTVNVAGVKDISGNVLATPVSSSFTTGVSPDVSLPQITSVNPTSYSTGVSTLSTVQVQFNKPIDPLTVISTTFLVYPSTTSIPMPGTIAVAANGLTATFTPSLPLDSLTFYVVELTGSITDLEGHNLTDTREYFTTLQAATEPAPNVITLSPSSAQVGTSVDVEGMYFGPTQGSSTITFNGVPVTPTSWSDVEIAVTVPAGTTSGPVVVTANGVASNSVPFTVYATPTITSLNPSAATIGSTVTITGTNFGDSYDSLQVYFSENVYPAPTATIVSQSPTSIQVIVPASAETGSVQVLVNGDEATSPFTVIPTPMISQLSPPSGVAGTTVAIYGTNFGSSQGSSTVSFNGVLATVTEWSTTYIVAVAPGSVTTGPVSIVENSVPSNTNAIFTVTNPAIGSLSPPSGAAGATITVNGSGLTAQGLTTQIFFNGVAGYVSSLSTANSLSVQVPSNATSGPVTVEVGTISSNTVPFTVEQPPTITSVSPNSGPFVNGIISPVTINGSGFGATQSNSTVIFWMSQTSPTVVSWSDTQIVIWVPIDAGTGPLTVTVGGITATSPSWFNTNLATVLTDSLGNQTNYTFQNQGGQWFNAASQGPGCVTCTMRGNITNVSDGNGNILTSTDDLGNTTTYTYDSANDMTSVSKPLNTSTTQTTSYTYNSFGEVLTITDPLGNVTTNTYDAHGNLLTVTTPVPSGNIPASVTQFQYATNGELTQITDPNNNVTKLTYTPTGLIASITDAQNNLTTYQYDARGNRTAVIDPVNGPSHPTSFTYDIMSRLLGITLPDGSTVNFTYDARGRRITSTDQNNKTTYYTYDDADRLTSVTDPANNVTQYAYDTEDNRISVTDANNHTTQFAYNARGWVTQTTFPSTLQESYAYDLVGHLLSKTDRKGNTIQYLYDALYRLMQKTYPDTTSVEYAYDLAGKVLQVNDSTGVYGFSYDNMGRLIGTSTQYAYLPGFNFQNTYSYDAASNRTSLTAPDGSVNSYGYDTLNRLNGLSNTWAGSFGFIYDALSRRTQLARPNGVNTNYTYDPVSHLLSVLHQAGANTLDGASYTYDPAGNRTAKTNYLNAETSNYSYDPIYELTQVLQGGSTTESYSYDPVGNRLSSSGVPTYNYNASNELTSNSNGGYTYDNNGNTLTDAQGRSYTWDFENRLTQAVVTGANAGTTTFRYDPFGRRIQKSGPLGSTNYLYDQNSDIEEVDNSGNVLARYARTKNLDEPLSELRSGATSYYQQDGLGSVTSLSNTSGSLAETYAYDSYGRVISSTGSLTNPFQYTGREFDSETTLLFNRARYFDPNAGRFLSQDPIRFDGGVNFYAYTRNNPVLLTDPFGYQGGCPPQSPNCVPTDPDAPYQGPDGLWYNVITEWHNDPTPPVPDEGPTPPPPPSSPANCRKKCDLVNTIGKKLAKTLVWHMAIEHVLEWEWLTDTAYSVSVAVAEEGIPIAGQLILLYEVTEFAGDVYVEYQKCKDGGSE
jgi:RHS repeat-associated protein